MNAQPVFQVIALVSTLLTLAACFFILPTKLNEFTASQGLLLIMLMIALIAQFMAIGAGGPPK